MQVVDPADEIVSGAAADGSAAALAERLRLRWLREYRGGCRSCEGHILRERVLDQRRIVIDDLLERQREREVHAGDGPHKDQSEGAETDRAMQIPVQAFPVGSKVE